jgi:hypothetical protein
VNNFYKENHKPRKKDIKEDYRRWRDLSCSWIGRISIVKMAIPPKTIYMFNAIPIKITMTFITEIEKIYLKVHLVKQETMNSQGNNSAKRTMIRGITIPNFKLCYKIIAIKTTWYWHKNRHEDQWNRIKDPDMNPHNAYLIFDKDTENIRWRKDSIFNKCCWEKWLSVCKKLKLDPCLSPCTSINLKWIKDLSIRAETLKLV